MRNPFLRRQSCLVCLLALTTATYGLAAPSLVKSVDQKGDFVLLGNSLGWDCNFTPVGNYMPAGYATAVNTLCGTASNTSDSAIDIYWSDDGAATPTVSVTSNTADARSTAVLELPTGATVTYARLYWAAHQPSTGSIDSSVVIDRPGNTNQLAVSAQKTWTAPTGNSSSFWYQGAAEITEWVASMGAGAFRVSGVTGVSNVLSSNLSNDMAGWSMVVFYERPGDTPRNLALFEGLDSVNSADATREQTVTLDGFLVPQTFDAKLGVVAYEGDYGASGDALSMGPNASSLTTLSNALNPADNFFNSSRTHFGSAVSKDGDMPKLTGAPRSMSGIDIDVVDVKSIMSAGQTSATIRASSSSERYALAVFATSISTFKPDFSSSGKTVEDKNGKPLQPNDTLVYTVTARNTGSDTSTNTVMRDTLPTQVTYVAGSLVQVTSSGDVAISDTPGNDIGEYDGTTRTLTVRLGAGANQTTGGTMNVGDTLTFRFEVTLNPGATGLIENQAIITAAGVQGAPASDYPTDGNGEGSGNPPTEIGTDADGDGMPDVTEIAIGTLTNDADSDDDGVPDGDEPSPDTDTDGDGLINALDPDSDNDGLFDGTELGLGCAGAGTDASAGSCRPDLHPESKTNPLLADTDAGGTRDGSEDVNLNGRVDAGETNPIAGQGADDAMADTDGDGLSNGLEATLGSNANDKDSDDDGVLDGLEPNPSEDGDGDGLLDVVDPDSDNDGLFDGTEMSYDCNDAATNAAAKHCVADTDPATHTSPLKADTDGGGVSDGNEDTDRDGAIDRDSSNNPTETDPNLRSDDGNAFNLDTDQDGLSDRSEATLESDPNDADSDDDGVMDGHEANLASDTDGDGTRNLLDPDSDGDGLFDGTELGKNCVGVGTASASTNCIADADSGATKTSMVDADTDNGGKSDGVEDANKNGAVDTNERNPNLASDDVWQCTVDAECNASVTSGRVCNGSHSCVDGCRGSGGNGCPNGQVCSSTTTDIGTCGSAPIGAAGAAGATGSPSNGGATPGLGGSTAGGAVNVAGTTSTLAAGGIGTAGAGVVAGATSVPVGGATTGSSVPQAGATNAVNGGSTALGGQGTVGGSSLRTTSSGATPAVVGGATTTSNGTGSPSSGGTPASSEGVGDSVEGAGCDCGVAGKSQAGSGWLLALVAGLLLKRRRRA